MNTWTPIFRKIVDSSVWMEDDAVCKVWITLLALKDRDQVVRSTAFTIGKMFWPREDGFELKAMAALERLASPDRSRVEPQPYDGRRIEKVEGGWLILNGQKYEDIMRGINRNRYQAEKQAEYRRRKKAVTADRDAGIKAGAQEAIRDGLIDLQR